MRRRARVACLRRDRDDAQIDVEPPREPSGALDELHVARARRDAEHDARERPLAPALGSRAQHLAHGELAQRREVLGAEEVGERRSIRSRG